jgi:hypothetical protein
MWRRCGFRNDIRIEHRKIEPRVRVMNPRPVVERIVMLPLAADVHRALRGQRFPQTWWAR